MIHILIQKILKKIKLVKELSIMNFIIIKEQIPKQENSLQNKLKNMRFIKMEY